MVLTLSLPKSGSIVSVDGAAMRPISKVPLTTKLWYCERVSAYASFAALFASIPAATFLSNVKMNCIALRTNERLEMALSLSKGISPCEPKKG